MVYWVILKKKGSLLLVLVPKRPWHIQASQRSVMIGYVMPELRKAKCSEHTWPSLPRHCTEDLGLSQVGKTGPT